MLYSGCATYVGFETFLNSTSGLQPLNSTRNSQVYFFILSCPVDILSNLHITF